MVSAAKNKTYQPLIEELCDQGWDLTMTANAHWRAAPPAGRGEIVIFAESRDPHAFLNTVRKLRDNGLSWPPPSKAERASERRKLAEIEPIVRSTPFPPEPMDVMPEPKLHLVADAAKLAQGSEERAYAELKDARDYARLADEHLTECDARLAAIQAEADAARAERDRAVETLRAKKSAFDRAFEAP